MRLPRARSGAHGGTAAYVFKPGNTGSDAEVIGAFGKSVLAIGRRYEPILLHVPSGRSR